MLVRSAGRRQHRHTSRLLATSFAQLNLPWLAPAQLRWSASQAAASPYPTTRPLRRSYSKASQQAVAQLRHLATAADHINPQEEHGYPPHGADSPSFRRVTTDGNNFRRVSSDGNLMWENTNNAENNSVSSLRPYSDPIILNSTIVRPEPMIKIHSGMIGSAMDLLQHLYTTLRVARMPRAENIIKRLAEQSPPNSAEVLHAHTAYLEELLRHLAAAEMPERASYQLKMQKWFEVELISKNIQPDEKLLVVMIRAAIRGLQGSRRDRAIRRYVSMAGALGEEGIEEVQFSEDYDDNEFTILGAATSEFQELPLEMEHEEAHVKELDMTKVQRLDRIDPDELPAITSVEQKGEGLDAVKRSLETITKLPPLPLDAPIEAQRVRAYERQRLMEETSVDVAVERWRKEDGELKKIGITTAMQTKPLGALMWQWYSALLPALKQELEACKKDLDCDKSTVTVERAAYAQYLELLPLRKLAANTILHTMGVLTRGKDRESDRFEASAKIGNLIVGLGKTIEEECAIDAAKRAKTEKRRNGGTLARANKKQKTASGHNQSGRKKLEIRSYLTWPTETKAKLGAMLISKLIETAQVSVTREHPRTREKVTQMQPAFIHRMKYHHGKRVGLIQPNNSIMAKIKAEPVGSLIAKRMPMIVEPRPWSGWNEGGYLQYPTNIVRLNVGDKGIKDYFMAADAKGDTKQLYAGLTALGKVPWKVNHHVLKVQIEAWNSGEAVANFAPMNPEFNMPEEPEPSADPMPRRKWLMNVRQIENKKTGLHSQRCFQNFQLEIARAVANETLYFPHNVDFRGRAYPIPPYLNHMGADNARGLLVFSDGKELGELGLRWLKIHLANVAGYDKASLQEREDYTMAHLDDIYDSVRNPLGGRRWWLESEDAWQTLAACYELTSALDSPDPTKYISHLPIHQDGTCNGLQHYAALGGDSAGAAQVNLEPGDRPADIYTAVANAVNDEVNRDAAEGNAVAKLLQGNISRKVVKQPVMTNVYGVTFYGAQAQVRKQMLDIFPDIRPSDQLNHGHISHYIAKKIFKSLGDMFKGAQSIQVWLGQCADRISTSLSPEQIEQLIKEGESKEIKKKRPSTRSWVKPPAEVDAKHAVSPSGKTADESKTNSAAKPLFKSSVTWTTPLRIPVTQPYRSATSKGISTHLQNITLQEPQVWDPVSKRKQLQAFPPNFIHSLDATHMMLSALKCNEIGLTFASIHDSFWTHACDIEKMSVVLRDAFVTMHSEDIIGRLREEFEARYKDHMFLAPVISVSRVGVKITALRKEMGSRSDKPSELAMERERLRLLASEDPTDRAKGEEMITPASIILSEADASAFAPCTELTGQTLGEIPSDADKMVNVSDAATDGDADLADEGVSAAEPNAAEDVVDAKEATKPTTARRMKGSMLAINGKTYDRKLYVWLPMAFPEVPAKGDFDVKRLKSSKYFFH